MEKKESLITAAALEACEGNIKELLNEWLEFSSDVQPSCAAGQDQLLYLESRTKAILSRFGTKEKTL